MDQPQFVFDIEYYKRQSRMEEELIVKPLMERRKKILEEMQDSNGERTKRRYFHRDHVVANQRLIDDYFSNQPMYDEAMFRRRFRMQKPLFLRIVGDLFLQPGKDNLLDKGTTTVILEAVASHDLWIWHAFFGCPGTLNDINVLDRSPVFDDVEKGNAPKVNFFVNGHKYNMTYYLADGIYPSYPTLVKSIRLPITEQDKLFAKYQEVCRKDVERACEPAQMWDIGDLTIIMRTCIILHNMIVEDERDTYAQNWNDFDQGNTSGSNTTQQFSTEVLPSFHNHVRSRSELRDSSAHHQLKASLVEHI
ncbi:hypothetical protein QL285_016018 [Trifolium repens]|nr:hypothetical protein QL285_016018 [Trifolium repens]